MRAVRGRGLLVAVDGPADQGLLNRVLPGMVAAVSRRVFGQWLALRLLEEGIVAQPATQAWSVLKLTPPLTVSDAEIDRAVAAITGILADYRDLAPLLRDVGLRLGRRLERVVTINTTSSPGSASAVPVRAPGEPSAPSASSRSSAGAGDMTTIVG